ncbi:uncharacterized protein LOC111264608 isoform X3 [Varroa jacobsoni]|uniref:uncharacterized protein LOC111264608 isoform X3 n=1 Tax=Varroa jacobsoni TaxID=62625 RepID=UPI000BF5FB59|nr:uncharacterized protein LOC111264608 isoform X3 [Varroa jacobsoni]
MKTRSENHVNKPTVMAKKSTSSPEYERRLAIVQCLHAGRTPAAIINFFGYPRSTVYNIAFKYWAAKDEKECMSIAKRKIHDRQKTARTPKLIDAVEKYILDGPSVSRRTLARKVRVDKATIARIINEDLRQRSTQTRKLEVASFKKILPCNQKADDFHQGKI